MSFFGFIVVLGVLIFVHELGHFMAARAVGIGVHRFSIGLGPATPLHFERGDTEYVLAWIPFGGYVKMASEEEQRQMEALEGGAPEKVFPPEQLFENKPLWARILVISAGVLMNTLFAWVLFSGLNGVYGVPGTLAEAGLGGIVQESPAAEAGLLAQDRILAVDGEEISSWGELVERIELRPGRLMRFRVERSGEILEIEATPRSREARDPATGERVQVGQLGIESPRVEVGWGEAIRLGASQTVGGGWLVVQSVKGMLFGEISARELGGPLQIARFAGETARAGLRPFLSFMAFLSINLAVLNLLPIPVLDGGHLMFLLYEGILRRPVPLAVRERLLQVGLFLLLGLMVFAVGNDVWRMFTGS
jgi:regulator of sigma E protease